jgi:hypothetical protein
VASSRHTIAALDQLERVLVRAQEDIEKVLRRVSEVRQRLEVGDPLSQVIEQSQRPLIIETLSALLDRLGDASSALRRSEAQQLFAEGFTRTRIAATFGVSRQRATTLLTRAKRGAPGQRRDAAKAGRGDTTTRGRGTGR